MARERRPARPGCRTTWPASTSRATSSTRSPTMLADRIGTDPYGGPNLLGPDDIAQIRKELADEPRGAGPPSTSSGRGSPRSGWSPTSSPIPSGYLPDEDAAADPPHRRPGTGPPPTCRCSTRPPNCSARTTGAPAPPPSGSGQTQIAYAQGVLDVSYASRTYEFEDRGRRGLRGPRRARHHRRRADGRAARGGRPPQRRRARRRRPDLGVRAHHRRRGAGAVADGVAAADAAQPDPLDDPGRRPGADRGGGRLSAPGRRSSPRTSRTAGSTPGSASTTARPPRSWTSRPRWCRAARPRLRAAALGALHGGTALGARHRTTCPARSPRRSRELTPDEGRLAVIAPRELHARARRPAGRRHGGRGAGPDPHGRAARPAPGQGAGVRHGARGRAGPVRARATCTWR